MSCDPTRVLANGCQGRHCLVVAPRLKDRELGRGLRGRFVIVSGHAVVSQAVVQALGLHGPAI